jgi:hypothetical protein
MPGMASRWLVDQMVAIMMQDYCAIPGMASRFSYGRSNGSHHVQDYCCYAEQRIPFLLKQVQPIVLQDYCCCDRNSALLINVLKIRRSPFSWHTAAQIVP